jgi:hypothetical protein
MRKLYPVFITLFLFISAGTAYFFYPKENYSHRVPFVVPTNEEEHEDADDEDKKMAMMGQRPATNRNLTGQLILH